MKLEIEQISNGFIISYDEEWEDGIRTEKETIEETDSEKETMSKLLYRISEHFGIMENKWNSDNLKITWDKEGSKVD